VKAKCWVVQKNITAEPECTAHFLSVSYILKNVMVEMKYLFFFCQHLCIPVLWHSFSFFKVSNFLEILTHTVNYNNTDLKTCS
jgi:hypothetical protein